MIAGTTPRISRSATRDHGRPAWREVSKHITGKAKPDIDRLIADESLAKDDHDVPAGWHAAEWSGNRMLSSMIMNKLFNAKDRGSHRSQKSSR
jgi:hypothetical protein